MKAPPPSRRSLLIQADCRCPCQEAKDRRPKRDSVRPGSNSGAGCIGPRRPGPAARASALAWRLPPSTARPSHRGGSAPRERTGSYTQPAFRALQDHRGPPFRHRSRSLQEHRPRQCRPRAQFREPLVDETRMPPFAAMKPVAVLNTGYFDAQPLEGSRPKERAPTVSRMHTLREVIQCPSTSATRGARASPSLACPASSRWTPSIGLGSAASAME